MGRWIGIAATQIESNFMEVTVHMKVLPFELTLCRRQMLQKGRERKEPLGPSAGAPLIWPLPPPSAHSLSHFCCLHSVEWLLVSLGFSSLGYFKSRCFPFSQLCEQGLQGAFSGVGSCAQLCDLVSLRPHSSSQCLPLGHMLLSQSPLAFSAC